MRDKLHEPLDTTSNGIVDLMTSLAVMFILLLAAQLTRVSPSSPPQEPVHESPAAVEPSDASPHPVAADPDNHDVMTVVIPDSRLHFEFGKSTLSPAAKTFLQDALPRYVTMLCGPDGDRIESFVIEGHTDDLGDDVHNLRLSQDRSFAVLVKSFDIVDATLPWASECLRHKASASGRGRQELIRDAEGRPDRDNSRRVLLKFHLRRT